MHTVKHSRERERAANVLALLAHAARRVLKRLVHGARFGGS